MFEHFNDIDLVERVQRPATKLITAMKNTSYDDRVKRVALMQLNTRKLKSDSIQTLKIINGNYTTQSELFLNLMMATEEDIVKKL